jgi:hypothetical protein
VDTLRQRWGLFFGKVGIGKEGPPSHPFWQICQTNPFLCQPMLSSDFRAAMFTCPTCKKQLKTKRNLKAHRGRRVCKEARNPRLRAARLKIAKEKALKRDAARKRAKYTPKLPVCDLCAGTARAWMTSVNCDHSIHRTCFEKLKKSFQERDPDFGCREGDPPCPYCRLPFTVG